MRNVQQWLQQQKERNLRLKEKEKEKKKLQQKAYLKQYREEHKEYYKEYQRNYRLEHSAELQQKAKVYRDNHREYYREYWRDRQKGVPTKKLDDYVQPPVKSKQQAKEIYQKWLQQLQEREPFLKGSRLKWNQLMQNSLKETLMGRNKHTMEEIKDRIIEYQERLTDLQTKLQTAGEDDKNDLKRKIASTKVNLSKYQSRVKPRLPREHHKEPIPARNAIKAKLQEIEQKAKQMMALATSDDEIRVIKERLEICRLRVKYSYN